tara:strand:+ start:989 stop:2302 length:1314 start_codon:yes stop_codon:yes gene_type:complete
MIKFLINFLTKSYHRPTAKLLSVVILIKSFFYSKKTNIFSERMMLLKDLPESSIYYNFFGRIFFVLSNLFTITFFNKYTNNKIFIDKSLDITNEKSGSNNSAWPHQAIHLFEKDNHELTKADLLQLETDYFSSIELLKNDKFFSDSPWWVACRKEFKDIFLNTNKINEDALKNFRNNFKTQAALLNDQTYLDQQNSEKINKIKSLSLINLYHKLSNYIDLSILRMSSESIIGKNICLNYRGQRLSHRVLRHAYFSSQIFKNTSISEQSKNLFLDLGGGYGGLSRILKNIYKNSTFVIIELPEVCFLANYFLKQNFANKKIGTFKDFDKTKKISAEDLKKYDFVILPQPFIKLFEDDIFNLVINTTSLGEMTNQMQNFYIEHIERITSDYFYSINRPHKRVDKYNAQGFYDIDFKRRWIAKIYQFTHTYHIEFLGKKK